MAAVNSIAEGEANPAVMRESANVARAMVAVSGEIRQLEKSQITALEALPPERIDHLVTEYLLGISPLRRRKILEQLGAESDVELLA